MNREFFIITYRTDPEALSAVIPAPLEMTDPIVKFESIRMPDSTGFGDYTESGQVIPVSFRGQKSGYVQSMYLNDHALIAAGRGALGFPKKLAHPELRVEKDTLGGVLQHGPVPVAVATMGYKQRTLDHGSILESLLAPSFRLKIIPHADGTPRISRMHWSELYHPATSPARPARLLCGPDAASEGLQRARALKPDTVARSWCQTRRTSRMPTSETSGRRDDRRRLQLPKQGNQMLKARHMIHTAVQETRIGPQRPGALFGLRRRPDIRPRGWWASALAAVSILVLLVTTSAVRADGLSGNEASLGDRTQLTGNWGSSRDRLQEQGLSFTSRLSQFVQGMTAGDGEHNFRYGGKFDLGVRADLATLGFWDGLSLTAKFEYNFGQSVNGRGGTMVPVNTALAFPGIDGSDAFDLTSFYFAQSFGSSANLLIGKINMIDAAAGKPFAGGAGIDSFWNTTFAAPPSGLVPPYMLGAILTVATPAAKYNLWVYDPLDCVNRSCLDAPFSEGVTVRGSVDIPVTIGGLPGHQGFVALYSTYDGTDLDSLDGLLLPNPDPASLNIKSDRYYFAYTFDQYLYQSPSNPAEGIGLFGQFGISDGNPTRLYWSAQLGLGGVGLIPGRSNDNWGVAYYYDALSGALKDSVGTVTTLNDEQGLEIFYNFTVTPWLTIGADLQIIDPALADETAVFFGIRTVVEF